MPAEYAYHPVRGLHWPAPAPIPSGWITRRCCASEAEARELVEHLQAQAERQARHLRGRHIDWEYRAVPLPGGEWAYQTRARA